MGVVLGVLGAVPFVEAAIHAVLVVVLSGANTHDSMVFQELLDAVEPIKRPSGRPTRQAARRQGVRRPQVQADTQKPWRSVSDSSQGHRQPEAGAVQVGGGENPCVA